MSQPIEEHAMTTPFLVSAGCDVNLPVDLAVGIRLLRTRETIDLAPAGRTAGRCPS